MEVGLTKRKEEEILCGKLKELRNSEGYYWSKKGKDREYRKRNSMLVTLIFGLDFFPNLTQSEVLRETIHLLFLTT